MFGAVAGQLKTDALNVPECFAALIVYFVSSVRICLEPTRRFTGYAPVALSQAIAEQLKDY